ncbi:MAG: antitoxin VapB family protein [Candidatus Hodarchaeales archaeon]|jgi:predicted CopG family antitoxin
MAHKTITISEKAYNALKNLKKNNESFTEVILRVTESVKKKEDLLEWVERSKVKSDLADSIEIIFKERGSTTLRY